MGSVHIIKRGDNAPSLSDTIRDSNGAVPNLVGATVYFHYVETLDGVTPKTGATVNTKTVTIVSASSGDIRVDFTSADTATAKRYIGEYEVRNGVARETFPNAPYDWVEVLVVQDLADGA